MKEMQVIFLLVLVAAAALQDLYCGRISNGIICTGIIWGAAYQIMRQGIFGMVLWMGGCLLPVLLFGGLYYFRMIGAGDIKLLCAVGSFVGPLSCFFCIIFSILFGGLISLAVMLHHHNFCQRLFCFSEYIEHYSREKIWRSYTANVGADGKFCFSVPVLFAVLCYIGGIF